MSRREFPPKVKVAAFQRANGRCEECGVRLVAGNGPNYDHRVSDGLGGEPTLENCEVLCIPCHGEKTRKRDIPAIAKAKRREAKHIGAHKPRSPLRNERFKRKVTGEVVPR